MTEIDLDSANTNAEWLRRKGMDASGKMMESLIREVERLRMAVDVADGERVIALAERDEWFNAYNELRDKGDPSWDMVDALVSSTVVPYQELRVALSNYMDKPWASDNWWAEVQRTFLALSPEWTAEDLIDPYALGVEHGRALEAAGPWTQEEIDAIKERARVRAAELRELAE